MLVVFWLSVVLIFFSYAVYPLILNMLAKRKKENDLYFSADELPFISVIIAAYNEQESIAKKIESTVNCNYPNNKIEILVGSDASGDRTVAILQELKKIYPTLRIFDFHERRGKPAIVNDLVAHARGEILIMTDAKVFFREDALIELVKNFKNPEISIVGANLISHTKSADGISFQEYAFMSREIKLKYHEGLVWGKTIGVYGACYAIRKDHYTNVPGNFSVDDFYITLKALMNGGKAIMNLDAVCFENVPNEIDIEFRRKVRISAGNFRNLLALSGIFLKPFSSLFFAYFSHKVIRWFGPFLLILALISNLLILDAGYFYYMALGGQLLLLFSILIDNLLGKFNVHNKYLRFIKHFYAMNLALLIGFFKAIAGKKTNIWQPTKR
jgi:cellulose synthase/poly-beta-1,6-N-acetylglucosamine synthase-like glycosyltransferase